MEKMPSEATEILERVAQNLGTDLTGARQAIETKWVRGWCPALPEGLRGQAESVCGARDRLAQLAREHDVPLRTLLREAAEGDRATVIRE